MPIGRWMFGGGAEAAQVLGLMVVAAVVVVAEEQNLGLGPGRSALVNE